MRKRGEYGTQSYVAKTHACESDSAFRFHGCGVSSNEMCLSCGEAGTSHFLADLGRKLALTVRAAEPLIANCFVIQSAQLLDIGNDFMDCIGNSVHIFNGAAEELMRQPHCFLIRSAIRFGTGIHIPEVKWLFSPPTQGREI